MSQGTGRAIAAQLTAAEVAINNTLTDADVKSAVAQFGYTEDIVNEGKQLYDQAVAAVNAQTVAVGAQRDATAQMRKVQEEAKAAFQDLAKVARAVFVNDQTRLTALGLKQKTPQTTAPFIVAGYALFDNVQSVAETKAALARYGFDDARLQEGRAKIAAFDQAYAAQVSAKGTAQQGTTDRDAALHDLGEWLAQYIKVAKVALRGRKQLLEKIGVTARSSKTPAQRAAPKKAAATRQNKNSGTP